MASVRFRESVKGHLGLGEPGPQRGEALGRRRGWTFELRTSVSIADFDAFQSDPNHTAELRGKVRCNALGGHLEITNGTAQSFAPTSVSGTSEIRYHGWFKDSVGNSLTFYGRKIIRRGSRGLFRLWPETTTVYLQVLQGHVAPAIAATALDAPGALPAALTVVGAGVPRASLLRFIWLLATFRGSPSAIIGFCSFFLGQLWVHYRPWQRGLQGNQTLAS